MKALHQYHHQHLVTAGVIAVAMAMVTTAGVIAYKHNQRDDRATKQTAIAQTDTAKYAREIVKAAIDDAIAYTGQTAKADQGEIDAVKDVLSPDLYTKLSQSIKAQTQDPIVCTSELIDGYTLSIASLGHKTANIKATVNTQIPITVLYTVNLATYQLANITCPKS
jgi:hypothetical protein